MIRKAKAVWRGIGRAGSGNLSTGSSVLLETLCLLKNLAQWGQAGACPLPNSRSSTLVSMMQAADLGEGNNIACRWKVYGTRPRAVLC
jgi:hypothetical protein